MSVSRRLSARVAAWSILAVFVSLATTSAQEKPPVGTTGMSAEEKAMMDAMVKAATPGANHEMLGSLTGEWTFKNKMWMNPSAAPMESTGTASYSMLLGAGTCRVATRAT